MNHEGNGVEIGESGALAGVQKCDCKGKAPTACERQPEAGENHGCGGNGSVSAEAAAFAKASGSANASEDEAAGHVEESIFSWEHGVKVEPWPEPVDGAALLDALTAVLKRYVILVKFAAETLALWILHTYAFLLRDLTTYIGLESPEHRCGKTTLVTVLSKLANRAVVASNVSSPALFRVIEKVQPALLIDEADTFLRGNEELRSILNSGNQSQTAYVPRVINPPRQGRNGGTDSKDLHLKTAREAEVNSNGFPDTLKTRGPERGH